MNPWLLHILAGIIGVGVLLLGIVTEVQNPTLTRVELLTTFWPRYCLAVFMLGVAIATELIATESRRR